MKYKDIKKVNNHVTSSKQKQRQCEILCWNGTQKTNDGLKLYSYLNLQIKKHSINFRTFCSLNCCRIIPTNF